MEFRSSRYIDFDKGHVKLAPMELIWRLGPRTQQSFDQMLMVFECRVDVWQHGPAVEMLKLMEAAEEQTSVWMHAGYALIACTFSYFEMIGKILNPASKAWRTSKEDFNHGFCDVYPEFAPTGGGRTDDAVPEVRQFRDRVRNGMYHLAYTKSHLYIHNRPQDFPKDFSTTMERGERYYLVNPHSMTRRIVEHFPSVVTRLENPTNTKLREKFVEFYVTFHLGDN
jgi:hypothetical protein